MIKIKLILYCLIFIFTFSFICVVQASPNKTVYNSGSIYAEEGEQPRDIRIQGTRRGECIAQDNIPEVLANHTFVYLYFPQGNSYSLLYVLRDLSGTIISYQSEEELKHSYQVYFPEYQNELINGNYQLQVIIVCHPELALNPSIFIDF